MDHSTFENIKTWLQQTQVYIEENVIRLPRRDSIRLLIIIGIYCLLRPLLLKYGGIKQTIDENKALEEDEEEVEDSPAATDTGDAPKAAPGTPNSSGNDQGATWGERARQRQKRPIRELVEGNEESSGADAESDKEIEEFLRKTIK